MTIFLNENAGNAKAAKNMIAAKSKLAKLMAVENIQVRHIVITQASFDLKRRILNLPIWKETIPEVYDTFVGHEVGHALETPAAEIYGAAIAAVAAIGIKRQAAAHIINVVEDARIEKLMKRRYPGLHQSFITGYKALFASGMFVGKKGQSYNTMNFIDRINIHFKFGNIEAANIRFTKKERVIVARIAVAETFGEVEAISIDLVKYIKARNNKLRKAMEQPAPGEELGLGLEVKVHVPVFRDRSPVAPVADDEDDSDDERLQEDSEPISAIDTDMGAFEEEKPEGEPVLDDEPLDIEEDASADADDDAVEKIDTFDSATDEELEAARQSLVDRTNAMIPEYIFYPKKLDVEKSVDDYKTILREHARNFKTIGSEGLAEIRARFLKFKADQNPVISYLVRQFDQKKAADQYSRTSTSRTGVIDTNKLHSYLYNEDVFKRLAVTPGGKNHGLVMMIDFSSSMIGEISKTIHQLMVLVMFCRRAQIEFRVFGFTDADNSRMSSGNSEMVKVCKEDDVMIHGFMLREYFNSRMTTMEFNQALSNMFTLSILFNCSRYGSGEPNAQINAHRVPARDRLFGTPLNQALISARYIIENLKRDTNVQVVNFVVLTDGDSNGGGGSYAQDGGQGSNYRSHTTAIFQDRRTGIQYQGLGQSHRVTVNHIRALRDATGAKAVGFFLTRENALHSICTKYDCLSDLHAFQESWKAKKFAVCKSAGYDEYYLIDADSLAINMLKVSDAKIRTGGAQTDATNAETDEFTKIMKSRKSAYVILARFIDLISA